jgi:DNA gyrase/topoisomerase IV subunit B
LEFLPDPLIFTTDTEFDYDTLAGRLRELAYLNAGIEVIFTDYRLELLKSRSAPRLDLSLRRGHSASMWSTSTAISSPSMMKSLSRPK